MQYVQPQHVNNCILFERYESLDQRPLLWHTTGAMALQSNRGLPDFRQARHPSRVYSGTHEDGESVVWVFDSSLPQDEHNPRRLLPDSSRRVKDYCERFGWGAVDPGATQLAIALLLDVSGETSAALRWYKHFVQTYVRNLPATWTVPELDIALWLHCFDNARRDT